MKKVKMMLTAIMALGILSQSPSVNAQTPQTSGADTSRNRKVEKITDDGFVTDNIRQSIVEIRLAQLASRHATTPRVKEIARQMVRNERDQLKKLLSFADPKSLKGVRQSELDSITGSLSDDSTLSVDDPRAAATSGNTITDSLGSGSTGSGNVKGRDTGTIGRSASGKANARYTSDGNAYLYNNKSFLADAESLSVAKGEQFDKQWTGLMLALYSSKMDNYNKAVPQIKNPDLKIMATQAIPKIRLNHNMLLRISEGKYGAEGLDKTMDNPPHDNNTLDEE